MFVTIDIDPVPRKSLLKRLALPPEQLGTFVSCLVLKFYTIGAVIARNSFTSIAEIVAFTILSSTSLILYLVLVYKDPGYIHEEKDQIEEQNLMWDMTDWSKDPLSLRYSKACLKCEINAPIRSKHCKKCDRCVQKYDHHCFFFGKCVGMNNHVLFCVFITIVFASSTFAAFLLIRDMFYTNDDWFRQNSYLIPALLISIVFIAICGGLVVFHTFLILTNQTSFEYFKSHSIWYLNQDLYYPFNGGTLHNVSQFFRSAFYPSECQQRDERQYLIYSNTESRSVHCCFYCF
jgi:palmitoyltransferase